MIAWLEAQAQDPYGAMPLLILVGLAVLAALPAAVSATWEWITDLF